MKPCTLTRCASAAILSAALAACGGGGGGSSGTTSPVTPAPTPNPLPAPAPVTPPPAGCTVHIVADTLVDPGKTAGATVQSCGSGPLADVSWTQVSGPAVTLLASRSPTVAFETFEAGSTGTIRLRADATLANGTTASTTTDITVGPVATRSYITVRADHSVRPEANTSVRAWPVLVNGETVRDIVWTQTAGPTVTMDTTDNRLLMFKAPAVSAETVLKFRATLTTSAGRQDADDVIIGIDPQAALPNGYLFDSTQRVHPYRSASVYGGLLKRCTYDTTLYYLDSIRNNFCSAATLPLLHTEAGPGGVPSIPQIMGRVLVSHDYQGEVFEAFLQEQDPHGDFRRLLGGVTSIVIGSHVRPSYYQAATGAIYLDANYLWTRAEHRDLVTEVPDYRLAFDDELNYTSFGRQIRNNAYVRRSFPATERMVRGVNELLPDLGRLLYHELAHAGDFFAPSDRNLNPAQSMWGNVVGRVVTRSLPSDALAQQYPLTSVQWMALGQVLYQGAPATAEQKAYTAADVGAFLAADRASDDYAYSIYQDNSSREDLAMLFEEFMMSYRHGIQYDIGYTNLFKAGMPSDQVIVGWGQRGRIAEPAIKPRIRLVLQRVAPWIDPATVDTLPAPIMMRPGISWEANLVLGPGGTQSKQSAQRVPGGVQLKDDVRKPAHPRAWGH